MATLPFIGPAIRRRKPLTGTQMIIVATAALFFLFLIWASLAQVDEVTRGQGKVIPSSKMQIITAADPATVGELLVRSGQRVHKGELLVRLDNPESASQLGQLQVETQSLEARSSRLSAEGGIGGSSACAGGDCAGEQALRNARRSALQSKVEALQAAADQHRREAGEAAATVQSLQASLALAQHQVQMIEPLAAKNIVPANRPARQATRSGRPAGADCRRKRAAGPGRGARCANRWPPPARPISNSASRRWTSAARSTPKIAVNEQSLRGAEGKQNRTDLRSPVDGVVNDVQVTTIGSFVQPGQKIMEVVPMGDKLLVETRVKPKDIAFIKVGDQALVKVTAYDFSIYGGLEGKVVQVSADCIYDDKEKEAYFTVIVETDKSYLTAAGRRLPITPGMMTDTQIITGRKSVLTYLLKPMLKARSEALRER